VSFELQERRTASSFELREKEKVTRFRVPLHLPTFLALCLDSPGRIGWRVPLGAERMKVSFRKKGIASSFKLRVSKIPCSEVRARVRSHRS
jgi:hypothetical protein